MWHSLKPRLPTGPLIQTKSIQEYFSEYYEKMSSKILYFYMKFKANVKSIIDADSTVSRNCYHLHRNSQHSIAELQVFGESRSEEHRVRNEDCIGDVIWYHH